MGGLPRLHLKLCQVQRLTCLGHRAPNQEIALVGYSAISFSFGEMLCDRSGWPNGAVSGSTLRLEFICQQMGATMRGSHCRRMTLAAIAIGTALITMRTEAATITTPGALRVAAAELSLIEKT